jgi:hypothetical protein
MTKSGPILITFAHLCGDLTVPSFGPRVVCTKCGTIGAEARQNWRAHPHPFSGLVRAPARPTPEKVDLLLGVSADRV